VIFNTNCKNNFLIKQKHHELNIITEGVALMIIIYSKITLQQAPSWVIYTILFTPGRNSVGKSLYLNQHTGKESEAERGGETCLHHHSLWESSTGYLAMPASPGPHSRPSYEHKSLPRKDEERIRKRK
jgi:hypothetical protein